MKKLLLFITLSIYALNISAQESQTFKVTPDSIVFKDQTKFRPYKEHTDGVQINTPLVFSSNAPDLLWLALSSHQPHNPGLFSITSITSGSWNSCFKIKANGYVGILNNNPQEALEIGTSGRPQVLKVNGATVWGSDARLKENISSIPNSLGQLNQLNGVKYNLRDENNIKGLNTKSVQEEIPAKILEGLSQSEIENLYKEMEIAQKANKKDLNRTHYGFLAQDVEKVFPDLVYKDSAGMMSVDYIGLIPILVNALNEQQQQMEYIISNCCGKQIVSKSNVWTEVEDDPAIEIKSTEQTTEQSAFLEQNIPNPFNQTTLIKYYLPESVSTALLCFYDLQGKQLKQIKLSERNEAAVSVAASEFSPGIYLYALIADGKEIDVKRMILTE